MKKKREVSLPWHGFFVLQEATDTMNPAMLSRTVHVPSLKSSFSSLVFFNLLHLVALCHCQTASRREQVAEPLAADLCRLHFFFFYLSFILYMCRRDTFLSYFVVVVVVQDNVKVGTL